MMLTTKFIDEEIPYTGEELRSHFAYEEFDVLGDSIISFVGPAKVDEFLVDIEDQKNRQVIYSEEMLHFIVEHFGISLKEAVFRQRYLIMIISELIGQDIERKGDDLYLKDKKLSVSIATTSPVSSLIHVGINVSSENTPVPTIGLSDIEINPKKFAFAVMESYQDELDDIEKATAKVRAVT